MALTDQQLAELRRLVELERQQHAQAHGPSSAESSQGTYGRATGARPEETLVQSPAPVAPSVSREATAPAVRQNPEPSTHFGSFVLVGIVIIAAFSMWLSSSDSRGSKTEQSQSAPIAPNATHGGKEGTKKSAPAPSTTPQVAGPVPPKLVSNARTAKEYRNDGAGHLYSKNASRIYKGKLPPRLQAVGVLQLDIDVTGNIRSMKWMRAPNHVPAVIREIERTVRSAAPFPAPVQLGGVTYTDIWLWDKSGKFQLDTLTEGQIPSSESK